MNPPPFLTTIPLPSTPFIQITQKYFNTFKLCKKKNDFKYYSLFTHNFEVFSSPMFVLRNKFYVFGMDWRSKHLD